MDLREQESTNFCNASLYLRELSIVMTTIAHGRYTLGVFPQCLLHVHMALTANRKPFLLVTNEYHSHLLLNTGSGDVLRTIQTINVAPSILSKVGLIL